MTDQDILDFLRDVNPDATQGDIDAFRRMARAFDVDFTTPQDVHEKILASMDSICEELDTTNDRFEQQVILNRRIKFKELR